MFNGKFVLLLCGFLFAGVVLAEEMCGICKRAKGVHLAADRKDSPYRVAFEDPLYQKLKKALKNHVWFAGMLHGNLREGERKRAAEALFFSFNLCKVYRSCCFYSSILRSYRNPR